LKKVLAIIFLLAMLASPSAAQEQVGKSIRLYPIRLDGKAGYIDSEGKVVIKPKFFRAWDFSQGLAAVQINKDTPVFGYINGQGNFVIGPWQGLAFEFSEGLGLVSRSGGYGFIDSTGKVVIPAQFGFAKSFSDGMAIVILDNCIPHVTCGKSGYIDKSGKLVIEPQFRSAEDFHEGIAAVSLGNYEWTFINRAGKEITKQRFKADPKTGLVATTEFSEGLAGVKVGDKWGYVDKTGEIVVSPQFDEARKFSEGLAAVFIGCRWGYIDRTGNFVIKPQFRFASEFSEGLAAADPYPSNHVPCPPGKSHDKLGYIDKTGRFVVSAQFDLAFNFLDGIAKVVVVNPKDQNDLRYGYIDKIGNYIWRPTS
jgi:hypothetical protein